MDKENSSTPEEVVQELKKDARDIRHEQIEAAEEEVERILGDLELTKSPDEPTIFH